MFDIESRWNKEKGAEEFMCPLCGKETDIHPYVGHKTVTYFHQYMNKEIKLNTTLGCEIQKT